MFGPLNLDYLRAKVIEDIRRERGVQEEPGADGRHKKGSYLRFLETHMGFFRLNGETGVIVENPYALVAHLLCPTKDCETVYFVAKFLSFREGSSFFHVCEECERGVMTLRDKIRVFKATTFPFHKLRPIPPGRYETRCRQILDQYEIEKIKRMLQPRRAKTHEIVPETDYHRAITLRTGIENDDETRDHLNEGFRKRRIKKVWGI